MVHVFQMLGLLDGRRVCVNIGLKRRGDMNLYSTANERKKIEIND